MSEAAIPLSQELRWTGVTKPLSATLPTSMRQSDTGRQTMDPWLS